MSIIESLGEWGCCGGGPLRIFVSLETTQKRIVFQVCHCEKFL